MDIRDVLKEMRSADCMKWADAIEAAMTEPVAETWQAVIDRIAPAMEILSDHDEELHPAEAALALDRSRIRRELAPELVRIAEQLTDAAAEIERSHAAIRKANAQAEHFEREWYLRDAEIEKLQRKLMLVTNFPSHPGGHPDDQSGDAMVPEDWRHGWICAVAAMQESIGGKEAVVKESLTTGETSDGYHTFNELYEHRHALFLNLMSGIGYEPWISKLHNDGTGFDGWFIAGIELPTGTISYHLPERLWDAAVFTGATVMDRAPEWDGHTAADVVSRLYQMVAPYKDLSGDQK